MNSNILVKGVAVLLLVMVSVVVIKKCSGGSDDIQQPAPIQVGGGETLSEESAIALGIEADTEQDTVATLVGVVKELKSGVEQLRSDNRDLRSQNSELLNMRDNITKQVQSDIAKAVRDTKIATKEQLNELAIQNDSKFKDMLGQARLGGTNGGKDTAGFDQERTVWVKSLDSQDVQESGSNRGKPLDFLMNKEGSGNSIMNPLPKAPLSSAKHQEDETEPFYTIPKNSTLVGSTSLTALVGRVPLGGNITDPYSFKVVIGKDNLAANGIEVPEIAYSIASGKAIGDWTLGCVRGEIYSMTFVFKDGTIRTVPKAKDIYDGGTQTQDLKIGELSDNYGNPCVVGRRITNAYSYLAQRIGVTAAGAAADAAAASQTSTTIAGGSGGFATNTVIDGSTSDYIWGRTLSEGAREAVDWLDERQAQQFDAIYVPPGVLVALHITEQIAIDYDPNGRKTQHQGSLAFGGKYRELD